MPQLTGPERKVLYEVLMEHINLAQLGRILERHDLPKLQALVEGAFAELHGSCPPPQKLIEQNRENGDSEANRGQSIGVGTCPNLTSEQRTGVIR